MRTGYQVVPPRGQVITEFTTKTVYQSVSYITNKGYQAISYVTVQGYQAVNYITWIARLSRG